MNWNDIRYFLATAKTGNLTEAAILMKTSASTVARRVQELETSYGVALFNKRQSGYSLTAAGANILPHAQRVASEVRFLERQASSTQNAPQPVVKIEVPELLGAFLLVPKLAQLESSGTSVKLDISNSARTTRLTEHENDLVLRLKRPESGDYTAKRIGLLSRAIYAAPAYLSRKGSTAETSDFTDHNLIGLSEDFSHLGTAQWFRQATGHAPLWLRTANVRLQIDAVVAGLGMAALPKFIARHHGLVEINQTYASSLVSEIWLLRRNDTDDLAHIGKVADWIETIVGGYKSHLI